MVCILELIRPKQERLGDVTVYSFIYLCLGNIYLSQVFISRNTEAQKESFKLHVAFYSFSSLVIVVARTWSVFVAKCLEVSNVAKYLEIRSLEVLFNCVFPSVNAKEGYLLMAHAI